MRRAAVVVALALAAGGAGEGHAAPLTAALAPGVTIDWSRGVIIARGVGPADRNAPSPAIARVAARRAAIDQARARLRDAIPKLASTAQGRAIAAEVEHGPIVDELLGTDGSVRLSVIVGIEAIRQAAAGPRAAPAAEEPPPAPWYVDAREVAVVPAIGLALTSGANRWQGPIRYATDFAADPTSTAAGARLAPQLRATATTPGTLAVDAALPPAGVAVVVVVRPDP